MTFLLMMAGCWSGNFYEDGGLWDPEPIAASDGLYFTLPSAGALVQVKPDGTTTQVELDGARALHGELAPDGETVVLFAQTTACEDGPEAPRDPQQCLDDGGELVTQQELQVIRGGVVQGAPIQIPNHFNRLSFTSDGRQAVAWLEYTAGTTLDISAVDNVTEVMFVDLESVTATPVAIGDVADRILFDQDDARALVLSRSKVTVVELLSGDYEREVSFPLALDVDDKVQPTDLVLTADGHYAMLTIEGSGDLYVLDLVAESINIVSLEAVPSDLVVESAMDTSMLVYAGRAKADILDHAYFELDPVDLEEPVSEIHMLEGEAFLVNTTSTVYKDAYRVDLETGEVIEYRLENPAYRAELSPDGNYAVAFTLPEGGYGDGVEALFDQNYGVELISMADDQSVPLIATSEPVGLAFRGSGAESEALVLVEGHDELMFIDLARATKTPLKLDDVGLDIGTVGETFYITLDSPLGMVSFMDADGEITTVSGFAKLDFFPPETVLVDRSSEEG